MNDHGQIATGCSVIIYKGNSEISTCTLPCYPEEVSESTSSVWNDQPIVGRSSPITSFSGTGFRSVSFSMDLHRDMDTGSTSIETILKSLRMSVYGSYESSGIQPPITTFIFGSFKIKGIVRSISYTWKKPIVDNQYQLCTVSISIDELAPITTSSAFRSRNPMNPFNVSK